MHQGSCKPCCMGWCCVTYARPKQPGGCRCCMKGATAVAHALTEQGESGKTFHPSNLLSGHMAGSWPTQNRMHRQNTLAYYSLVLISGSNQGCTFDQWQSQHHKPLLPHPPHTTCKVKHTLHINFHKDTPRPRPPTPQLASQLLLTGGIHTSDTLAWLRVVQKTFNHTCRTSHDPSCFQHDTTPIQPVAHIATKALCQHVPHVLAYLPHNMPLVMGFTQLHTNNAKKGVTTRVLLCLWPQPQDGCSCKVQTVQKTATTAGHMLPTSTSYSITTTDATTARGLNVMLWG